MQFNTRLILHVFWGIPYDYFCIRCLALHVSPLDIWRIDYICSPSYSARFPLDRPIPLFFDHDCLSEHLLSRISLFFIFGTSSTNYSPDTLLSSFDRSIPCLVFSLCSIEAALSAASDLCSLLFALPAPTSTCRTHRCRALISSSIFFRACT